MEVPRFFLRLSSTREPKRSELPSQLRTAMERRPDQHVAYFCCCSVARRRSHPSRLRLWHGCRPSERAPDGSDRETLWPDACDSDCRARHAVWYNYVHLPSRGRTCRMREPQMEEHAYISADAAAKLKRLRILLKDLGSAAVAFSSGVDSTFLLRVAHEELGDRMTAVTVRSRSFPRRELEEAAAFCRAEGVRHEIVDTEELAIPGFADNPPDRCYHCKKEIFGKLLAFARSNGLAAVVEGSNADDDGDYRPGRRAIKELGVRSPLHEVGLTKDEIRALSRALGLPTWNKPSFACLASRFPYGERITAEGLARVERAEQWLREAGLGLGQLRVRMHGGMARIEVPPADIPRLAARAAEIAAAFKGLGFVYVALDLQGYRTGSMNMTLTGVERARALGDA